ncbi:hypothetical protein GGS24DRAFT_505151 [Hypoxylon argillaceum]|nr:hypothetical protein GGS24DRAFT_505151 [Hypoxylon argillaceum]
MSAGHTAPENTQANMASQANGQEGPAAATTLGTDAEYLGAGTWRIHGQGLPGLTPRVPPAAYQRQYPVENTPRHETLVTVSEWFFPRDNPMTRNQRIVQAVCLVLSAALIISVIILLSLSAAKHHHD